MAINSPALLVGLGGQMSIKLMSAEFGYIPPLPNMARHMGKKTSTILEGEELGPWELEGLRISRSFFWIRAIAA